MIDLHTHILPGIDDGSPDMDSTLAMAALAVEGGTEYLTATSHSNQMGRFENFYSPELKQLYLSVKQAIQQEKIPLKLMLGMEIFASGDMEEKIRDGRLIGLNKSRYYLVEFYFDEEPARIRGYLQSIFRAGGVPLIAHPERYYCVQESPYLLYDWLRMGCYAQLNKGSLYGRFGRDAERTAQELLGNGLITCVASDAHSYRMRTPHMGEAVQWMLSHLGEDITRLLTEENPRRILTNQPVPPHGRPPRQDPYFYD